MSIWTVEPPEIEPSTTLVRWQVMRVEDSGERHLVGWAQHAREGRVSSAVVSWDAATRLAVTLSGRAYELAGPPGADTEAQYVWQRWRKLNGNPEWQDVSAEAYAQIRAAVEATQQPKKHGKAAQ
jgi:hypothetical protein